MARTQGSYSVITSSRLREAALRLFAQHGYAAVSMRQIAREIGVQAGALYLYTPDKQTLLYTLMREHMEELLAAVPCDSGTPLERLERFCRFHIRFHHARRAPVFIAYLELRSLEPENFARIEALRNRYEAHLETILRDGIDTGSFAAPDAKLVTLALIAMLTGVTTWFRPDGRLDLAQIEAIYWDMVRKVLSV